MASSKGGRSNESTFRNRFDKERPAEAHAAGQILDWAKLRRLKCGYTAAADLDSLMCRCRLGVQEHKILTLQTNGMIWVLFDQLAARFPTKDQGGKDAFFGDLKARLPKIPGSSSAPSEFGAQAAWRLDSLNLPAFLGILDWVLSELGRFYQASLRSDRRSRE